MDAPRFDALARSLSTSTSRRPLVRSSLVGLLAALGITDAEAKKRGKKGKRKKKKDQQDRDTPACSRANCSGCCDGATCHPGNTNDRCERDGFVCENCTSQGLVCNENRSCGCDQAACYRSRFGCCLFDETCEFGTTREACGPAHPGDAGAGGPCDICRDHEICQIHDGRAFCCGQEGAFCGTIQAPWGFGEHKVPCCAGFRCGEDTLCHPVPACGGACNPTNQYCCGATSNGGRNVCMYTTGLNCPIPSNKNYVAPCPASDGTCCTYNLSSTCPVSPGQCGHGDTEAEPVTCLDPPD